MAKFIKLHTLHSNTTTLLDVYVNVDNIRILEALYTDDPLYDKGIRSQIVFLDAHMISVIEPRDTILRLIKEAK